MCGNNVFFFLNSASCCKSTVSCSRFLAAIILQWRTLLLWITYFIYTCNHKHMLTKHSGCLWRARGDSSVIVLICGGMVKRPVPCCRAAVGSKVVFHTIVKTSIPDFTVSMRAPRGPLSVSDAEQSAKLCFMCFPFIFLCLTPSSVHTPVSTKLCLRCLSPDKVTAASSPLCLVNLPSPVDSSWKAG